MPCCHGWFSHNDHHLALRAPSCGSVVGGYASVPRPERGTNGPPQTHQRLVPKRGRSRRGCWGSSSTACTRQCIQGRETPSQSQMDLTNDGITQGHVITMHDFLDALVPPDRRPFVRRQMPIPCALGHSSEPLACAFARASLYFNHFIKVHNAKMVNRKYLWCLFCRGAAVICANNQCGIDIIIPVLMGNILDPKFITAILVQVKNDATLLTTCAYPSST